MSRRLTLAGVRSWRRGAGVLTAFVLGVCTFLTGCTPPPVTSLVATGDSIALGFDACGLLSTCQGISYATGNDPTSDSVYRHLLASSPGLAGHGYNLAEVGAGAFDLLPQMVNAVNRRADVVTVLIGANDACAPTVTQMTPVGNFKVWVSDAFSYLFSHRPMARVVVSSIPNVYRVWEVAHDNAKARAVWQAVGLCQSMLANPTSTAYVDNLRRIYVSVQIEKYNQALQSVCASYLGCRWDGGAVTRYPFTIDQLSQWDYFHPNAAGHRALASIAWRTYGS